MSTTVSGTWHGAPANLTWTVDAVTGEPEFALRELVEETGPVGVGAPWPSLDAPDVRANAMDFVVVALAMMEPTTGVVSGDVPELPALPDDAIA